MVKKLKDLGGKKWEKYSSIKAAQKAGSIYYGKKLKSGKVKQMAAVLKRDLGKGQSLNSFMNEQLKGSKSTGANYKVKGIEKVRPKLRPKPADRGDIKVSNLDAKGNSRPGFDRFKKGKKIRDIVEPALKANVKNKKPFELERKDLKQKFSFVKTLSTEARADSTAAARYVSFSKVEKKLVKTLFQEGLTFKQAVAQVYGG